MDRVALVADRPNATNRMLADEWLLHGLDVVELAPADARLLLRAGDVAINRIDVLPTLDGVGTGLNDVSRLETAGVRVLNHVGPMLSAHDKLRTARKLRAAGVPHPRTVHVEREGLLPELPVPAVVKPRYGSWGRDVERCDTPLELLRVLASASTRSWFATGGALVQKLIPPAGYDLRVLVAGGRVVGAEERVAAPGEWRTNVSLGGAHRHAQLTDQARTLALRAVAAVGMDFCGVDLLPLPGGGWIVVEINGAVDFVPGYALPGRDLFEDVAAALRLPLEHEQPARRRLVVA